jgi:hypothetical protein
MIPWRDWFQHAVLTLRLAPSEFWAMSLAEWRLIAPQPSPALGPDGLAALLALYPDE